MLSIVVAHSANRVIGRDGGLPWRLPGDMRHFRRLTTGGTVLMGRRTYQSIPEKFRPLPERRNLVLSRDPGFAPAPAPAPGAGAAGPGSGLGVAPEVFHRLDAALEACGSECFVIGGAVTYAEALPLCARVYATEIEAEIDGDVLFPELSPAEWRLLEEGQPQTENGMTFRFNTYERASAPA